MQRVQARDHELGGGGGQYSFTVDEKYVQDRLLELSKREDLAKFVL